MNPLDKAFPNREIISGKRLQSLPPALFLVIDGINIIRHEQLDHIICKTDYIEIEAQHIDSSQINIEELYHILSYLQGTALNLAGLQRIFLRTLSQQVIMVDPRLRIPKHLMIFYY